MKEDLELFEVEISYIIPVLASNEREAEEVADRVKNEINYEEPDIHCLSKMTSLPSYYQGSRAYSKDGDNESDLTIDEIFDILKDRRAGKKKQEEIDALQYKLNL